MNQIERPISNATAPLQQYKGQIINKGYSYQEVKEENAVISIFKASAAEPLVELINLPPVVNN